MNLTNKSFWPKFHLYLKKYCLWLHHGKMNENIDYLNLAGGENILQYHLT